LIGRAPELGEERPADIDLCLLGDGFSDLILSDDAAIGHAAIWERMSVPAQTI